MGISDKILIEHTYIHIGTGNEYKVIGFVDIRHQPTGKWEPGVAYQSVGDTFGTYVRSIEDFKSNFEYVENTIET